MPWYDFQCEDCGATFDAVQKHQDAPPVCPQCGAPRTRRKLPTGTTFELKGSGWAKDHYGAKKP